jgi:hypothetical protein
MTWIVLSVSCPWQLGIGLDFELSIRMWKLGRHVAGGVLRTMSRMAIRAWLTFRVIAHTEVRDSPRGGVLQTVV